MSSTWFSDRSPVVTAQQSDEIVKALRSLGFVDAQGFLVDDPRTGQEVRCRCVAVCGQPMLGRGNAS